MVEHQRKRCRFPYLDNAIFHPSKTKLVLVSLPGTVSYIKLRKCLSLKLLKSVVARKFFELDFTQLLLLLNLSEKKSILRENDNQYFKDGSSMSPSWMSGPFKVNFGMLNLNFQSYLSPLSF